MYRNLRKWLHSVCTIEYIVHLPYDVFPDAYIDTIIFISQKSSSESGRVLIRTVWNARISGRIGIKGLNIMTRLTLLYGKQIRTIAFLTLLSPLVISIHNKARQFGIKAEMFLEVSRGMTPFFRSSRRKSSSSKQDSGGNCWPI